jgi:hypothetical protein
VVARGIADAGHKVIYGSLHQTPEMAAAAGGAGVGRRVGYLDPKAAGRFGVSWGGQLTEGESQRLDRDRIEKRIDPVSIWWSPGQIAASKCADSRRVTPREIGFDV